MVNSTSSRSSRSSSSRSSDTEASSVTSSSTSTLPAYARRISSISASQASSSSYDILIVGAGVLGSALSVSLARSGRRVLCIERDLTPPNARIVGELLQPGGCMALDRLGLLDALEGIDAVPVHGYMVIHATEGTAPIPYPVNGSLDEIDGTTRKRQIRSPALADSWNNTPQYQGRSFHHGRFVGSLRRRMQGQDNLDVLEATVNDLVECESMGSRILGVKVTATEDDGSKRQFEILAPLTIIADGHASKFRKLVNTHVPPPITRSYFVGVELDDCIVPNPNHGHVLLPDSGTLPASSRSTPSSISDPPTAASVGPVLVYALCSKTTRMLIDVSSSKIPSKAFLLEHVTPRLPECMRPSFLAALADSNPQKVKAMPNSWLPPAQQGQRRAKEGVFLAGDALNMRHPLTGGGMSVALNDAIILTKLFGAGRSLIPKSIKSEHPNGVIDAPAKTTKKVAFSLFPIEEREICDLEDWMDVSSRLEAWHWERKGVATCVNVLAMALYSLFGANDDALNVLRRGCIRYLASGGERCNGPVSLLSALRPSPPLLIYHFFAVAFFSIGMLYTEPRPSSSSSSPVKSRKPSPPSIYQYPLITIQAFFVFLTACKVILPVLWSEVDIF